MRYEKFLLEELSPDLPPAIPAVLRRLALLYGLWSLDAHSSTLYEGGYYAGSAPNRLVRAAILQLCAELKPDAIALVDVFAPPDFILNSVLGASNGAIYENIYRLLNSRPGAFERPSWWRQFTENKPAIAALEPLDNAQGSSQGSKM